MNRLLRVLFLTMFAFYAYGAQAYTSSKSAEGTVKRAVELLTRQPSFWDRLELTGRTPEHLLIQLLAGNALSIYGTYDGISLLKAEFQSGPWSVGKDQLVDRQHRWLVMSPPEWEITTIHVVPIQLYTFEGTPRRLVQVTVKCIDHRRVRGIISDKKCQIEELR